MDAFPTMYVELISWSKSSHSPCFIYKAGDVEGIANALAIARAQHLSVVPRGAGHSYTDAALNTNGLIVDTTLMRKILAWDPIRNHESRAGSHLARVGAGRVQRWLVALCITIHSRGHNRRLRGDERE